MPEHTEVLKCARGLPARSLDDFQLVGDCVGNLGRFSGGGAAGVMDES